jgi:hypothetical protein
MSASLVALFWAVVAGGAALALLQTIFKGLWGDLPKRLFIGSWLAVTASFFLSPSGPIFCYIALAILLVIRGKTDPLALALFLLPMVPAGSFYFGKLPGINFLLEVSFTFLVLLVLVVPTAIQSLRQKPLPGFRMIDLFVLIFFLAVVFFIFRSSTFTNSLRVTVVTAVTLLLPYYAFSRAVNDPHRLDRMIRAFAIGMFVCVCIGISVSQLAGWNMYSMQESLLFDTFNRFKVRGGLIRTGSTFGSSYIQFGMFAAAAAFAWTTASKDIRGYPSKFLLTSIFLVGAFISTSRTPFAAALLTFPFFALALPNGATKLAKGAAIGFVGVVLLSITSFGSGVLAYVPFIGDAGGNEVEYRQRLIENSWVVIKENFWFGTTDYLSHPLMQELVQGEGIIDIVNDYIAKALRHGVPVAVLYAFMHFLPPLRGLSYARRLEDKEHGQLRRSVAAISGAALLCACAYFMTSKTGSSLEMSILLIGLSVGASRIAKETVRKQQVGPVAADRPSHLTAGRKASGYVSV